MDRRLGLRSASVGAKPRSTGPRAPPIISVNQLKLVGCRPRGCNGLINDLHRFLLPQAVQVYFTHASLKCFHLREGFPGTSVRIKTYSSAEERPSLNRYPLQLNSLTFISIPPEIPYRISIPIPAAINPTAGQKRTGHRIRCSGRPSFISSFFGS